MEILFLEKLAKSGFSRTKIFNEIVELEKEFFPKYYYNIKDIRKFCKQSNGFTLILLDKNEVIGYLISLLFRNKDYLQILTVAVNKSYQKKGYGTKLIRKCEEIAKSLKLKRIIIRAENNYTILKTLKNLKYKPMGLKEINEFKDDGVFDVDDKIEKISNLFSNACLITKNIGKKNPFSFIPMIKHI